ncbi:MAG: MATE family efflux transporter [Chloracidobacterium sp.]|nr:MATE family efflux transporter [Chloracidobacterium sp.]
MANNGLASIVWKVSLPIIFVEATETLDHLIDSIFLARVGVTELGAIAVADTVFLLFLVFPLGLVDGIQILTARRVGQRRPEAVGAVFNQGLALVLLVCVVSAAALKLASPLVAKWLVESEAVGHAVDGYLQIAAYGIGLSGVTFAFGALLTSLGRTRALVPATVILIITNVVLNYIFVFGKFGCPALGMRGAAVGSLGAEFAVASFLIVYFWRRLDAGRYGFFKFRGVGRATTRLLGLVSMPIAVQGIVMNLRWFAFFLILERVGAEALAIANVVSTFYVVLRIPTEGFAETTCSMVSRFVGRNRSDRIGGVLKHAIGGALVATVPFIVAALVVPEWFVAVFSPEAKLLAQTSASLRVVALAMLIAIPGEMWFVAVLGTGDTLAFLLIESALTLTMIGLTYFGAIHMAWPAPIVWLSLPVAWLVGLTISYGWMKSGMWKRLELS